MFKGTPGGGVDVLPEMLRAAATEARVKGTSLDESMTSLIGYAHMLKDYTPDEIKKVAPVLAFLSASNPASLAGMERASSYAVPILRSGMEIDPIRIALAWHRSDAGGCDKYQVRHVAAQYGACCHARHVHNEQDRVRKTRGCP